MTGRWRLARRWTSSRIRLRTRWGALAAALRRRWTERRLYGRGGIRADVRRVPRPRRDGRRSHVSVDVRVNTFGGRQLRQAPGVPALHRTTYQHIVAGAAGRASVRVAQRLQTLRVATTERVLEQSTHTRDMGGTVIRASSARSRASSRPQLQRLERVAVPAPAIATIRTLRGPSAPSGRTGIRPPIDPAPLASSIGLLRRALAGLSPAVATPVSVLRSAQRRFRPLSATRVEDAKSHDTRSAANATAPDAQLAIAGRVRRVERRPVSAPTPSAPRPSSKPWESPAGFEPAMARRAPASGRSITVPVPAAAIAETERAVLANVERQLDRKIGAAVRATLTGDPQVSRVMTERVYGELYDRMVFERERLR